MEAPFAPDLTKWDAWNPVEAANRLAGLDVPWFVAAGWSLDLFLGGEMREHEDLEIAVPHERFGEIRASLVELDIFVPIGEGLVRRFEDLSSDEFAATHQSWAREPSTGLWRLDVFREPSQGDTWICRRDSQIRLPFAAVIARTRDAIPYAQPEITLLYKAKRTRDKDEADFAAVLPLLTLPRRQWLAWALHLHHPGHRWLESLR